MKGFLVYLRIYVCLVLLFAVSGQAAIYVCQDVNHQITRLKPACFSSGYEIVDRIIRTEINQLNPEKDKLIVLNGRNSSTEMAVQVSNFVRSGGRVVWFIKNMLGSNDFNDILAQRFGVMIDFTSSKIDNKLTYEGKDFFPLWEGLFLGTRQGTWHRNFLQLNPSIAMPLSTRQFGERALVSSAYSQIGAGEIIFICIPSYTIGGGTSVVYHSIFCDTNLEYAENQKAFEAVLAWLNDEVQLVVQNNFEMESQAHNRPREDLISRLISSEGIDPESEKGLVLAAKIRKLFKSARD